MNRLTYACLTALLSVNAPFATPLQQATDWTVGGSKPTSYALEATGRATDRAGATIALRSVADVAGAYASATSRLTADSLRGKRVSISGELQTRGATSVAYLWLRVDQGTTQLFFSNGADQAVRGDAEWTSRSLSLPVLDEATTVAFGVILQGEGAVSVRGLRLEGGGPVANKPLSPSAQGLLDAAISIVKTHSLRRADVKWDIVEPRTRVLASGAEQTSEVYPAIRYLLLQLGDHHSQVLSPEQWRQMQSGGSGGSQNPIPTVRVLPDGAGYVSVPGYSGTEVVGLRTYTTQTHEALGRILASVYCGWIVDLRHDTGGNMWPMLAGLKPFLGSSGLGTFEMPTSSGKPWIAGDNVGVDPPATLAVLESAWVAVLTGPGTASSGEAVTIAFRGRPRTRSFGQPTAGLSTANGTFPLPDGGLIVLTEAVEADRNGRRYGDKIDPDERVDAATDSDDPTLSAAVRWLKQSSGCGK